MREDRKYEQKVLLLSARLIHRKWDVLFFAGPLMRHDGVCAATFPQLSVELYILRYGSHRCGGK